MTFDVSGDAYDNFMGRYSVRLAPVFAAFAGIEAGQRVLDVGAGTGALTGELVGRGARVSAVDPSPTFVAALQRRLPDVDTHAAPAEELPFDRLPGALDGALEAHVPIREPDLRAIQEADAWARRHVREKVLRGRAGGIMSRSLPV